jgi:hypothetical protein
MLRTATGFDRPRWGLGFSLVDVKTLRRKQHEEVTTMEFEKFDDEDPAKPGEVVATPEQIETQAALCMKEPSAKRRLLKAAGFILQTTAILKGRCQPEDLLQEALFAVLMGRRAWKPNAVDFFGLLRGVMKSLAYNQDRSLETKDKHIVPEAELLAKDEVTEGEGLLESYGNDEESPETLLLAAEAAAGEMGALVVLRAKFPPPDLAGRILDKLAERMGYTLAEIRVSLNVSDREFWSAHRRLTRSIDELNKDE